MEKTIINYVSGGLGNILLPLSSCMAIAKKTGRKLILCWEPTFACMATFKDLFEDEIEIISKSDLLSFADVKIYGNFYDIQSDSVLFGDNSLNSIKNKFLTLPVENFNFNDSEQNIIVYHNNILPSISKEESLEEFKNLKWNKNLLSKIEELLQ